MRKHANSASHCVKHAQTAHRHATVTAQRSHGTKVTGSMLPWAGSDGRERTAGGTSSAARLSRHVAHMSPAPTGHGQRQRCSATAAGLQVLVRVPEQHLSPELQHAAQLMVGAGCSHAWPVASGHAHLLWWNQQKAGMGDTIKVTPCWKSAPTLSAYQSPPDARMPTKPISIRSVCSRAFQRCHCGRLDPMASAMRAQSV